MTHDPLCPVGVSQSEGTYCCQICNPGEAPSGKRDCQCDLISKVKADTLDKAYNWLSDFTPAPIKPDAPGADAFRTGYDLGRIRSREAVNAMRGVRV